MVSIEAHRIEDFYTTYKQLAALQYSAGKVSDRAGHRVGLALEAMCENFAWDMTEAAQANGADLGLGIMPEDVADNIRDGLYFFTLWVKRSIGEKD